MSTGGRRVVFVAMSGGAILGVPLLLLQSGVPQLGAGPLRTGAHVEAAAARPAGDRPAAHAPGWQLTRFHGGGDGSGTTGTTAPTSATIAGAVTTSTDPPVPTTTTTLTSAAPAVVDRAASATTTTAPPTTTTTAPPARVATVAQSAPVAADSEQGLATWYAAAAPGSCASPTLPFGTVVTVTNLASGARTSCVIDDREAANPGRVVDMSPSGFSEIAALSEGVVTVSVSW